MLVESSKRNFETKLGFVSDNYSIDRISCWDNF